MPRTLGGPPDRRPTLPVARIRRCPTPRPWRPTTCRSGAEAGQRPRHGRDLARARHLERAPPGHPLRPRRRRRNANNRHMGTGTGTASASGRSWRRRSDKLSSDRVRPLAPGPVRSRTLRPRGWIGSKTLRPPFVGRGIAAGAAARRRSRRLRGRPGHGDEVDQAHPPHQRPAPSASPTRLGMRMRATSAPASWRGPSCLRAVAERLEVQLQPGRLGPEHLEPVAFPQLRARTRGGRGPGSPSGPSCPSADPPRRSPAAARARASAAGGRRRGSPSPGARCARCTIDEEVRVADQVAHVERDHVLRLLRRPRSPRSASQAPPSPAASSSAFAAPRSPWYSPRSAMNAATPSGTRCRIGRPAATRRRMARGGDPDLRHPHDLRPIAAAEALDRPPPPPRAAVPGRAAIPSRASSSTRSRLTPALEPRGDVGTHQEDELVPGSRVAHQLQGTKAERRSFSAVSTSEAEQRIRRRRQPRHLQSHLRPGSGSMRLYGDSPTGTSRTSSSPSWNAASCASTRCPMCGGLNAPPRTPTAAIP